ncbi:hypothetical protein SAMN05216350_11333 [Polaromonas sp. YR568]|uniref:hypothetical protein n=1 Tax=Polaromonas sp. YR568 TaxID=1855301 RepID=UPI0008EA432C|nr:hypothetical protein [Polaromonas sp. YR568]SFV01579.1 hypothetical protein SAMN05216350_11333 [Polaromonas sp. YR568]
MPKSRYAASAIFSMLLMALAPVTFAQPAMNSTATPEPLPMRNLQIEVRQVRNNALSQSALGAQGGVTLQPGRSGANVNITAQDNQRSDSRDLVQRVLVLNGRNVNINLGNSQPLRLVQARQASTVFIDANSGFAARPTWYGGDSAELELAAGQASRTGSSPMAPLSSSSTNTSLSVRLGEWVTVAESDDAGAGSSSGIADSRQSTRREGMRVEVRLSVR